MYVNNIYLQHHGILGQKWGQRNGPPYPLNSVSKSSAERKANTGTPSNNYSEDYKNAHKSVSINELSDKELRAKLNRLQMEKQYKDLTRDYTAEINRGTSYVKSFVTLGTTLISAYTLGKRIGKLFNKKV